MFAYNNFATLKKHSNGQKYTWQQDGIQPAAVNFFESAKNHTRNRHRGLFKYANGPLLSQYLFLLHFCPVISIAHTPKQTRIR